MGNGGKAAADQQSDGHHGHIRQHPHPFVRQLGEAAEHKAQGVIRTDADVGREEQATGKAENEDTGKEKGILIDRVSFCFTIGISRLLNNSQL